VYTGKKLISLYGYRFSMIERFQHDRKRPQPFSRTFFNEQVTLSVSVQDMRINGYYPMESIVKTMNRERIKVIV